MSAVDGSIYGWLLISVSITVWSITPGLVARDRGKYDGILANGLRSLAASFLLFPFVFLLYGFKISYEIILFALAVGLVGAVSGDTSYIVALRRLGAGLGTPLCYTYVVTAQLIGLLFYPAKNVIWYIIASIIALIGVSIAYSGEKKQSQVDLLGILAGINASISWGLFRPCS